MMLPVVPTMTNRKLQADCTLCPGVWYCPLLARQAGSCTIYLTESRPLREAPSEVTSATETNEKVGG